MRVVLASASLRRAELLRAAGFEFDIVPAHVDESMASGEDAEGYVRRLAREKAETIVPRAAAHPVLGADTVVVVGREVLGKPADRDDARRMLSLLAGQEHVVMTGVCLSIPIGDSRRIEAGVETTSVEFSRLTDGEIEWYVASGEPLDKAGAYAIQGLGSRFIPRISGSYSNVVGLPMSLVYRLFSDAGLLVF